MKSRTSKKRMTLLLITLIITLCSVVGYSEAFGGKWNKSSIAVAIHADVWYEYAFPSQYAMGQWNDVNAGIEFTETSSVDSCDVQVKRMALDVQPYFKSKSVYAIGIPTLEKNGDGWTEVNEVDYSYGEVKIVTTFTNGLGYHDHKKIMTHEFGHILGLAHTTKWFTSSIMDESDVFKLEGPTTYDEDNLKEIY